MTPFQKVVDSLDFQFKRLDFIVEETENFAFENIDYDDRQVIKTLDSLCYRFAKIQDIMGQKLFPTILKLLGEYQNNMAQIDMVHRLERLELITHSFLWQELIMLRNRITHDYPQNKSEISQNLQQAIKAYKTMKQIYSNIKQRGQNV